MWDFFDWFMEHVFAPGLMILCVITVAALVIAGGWFGGKIVLGLGRDVHASAPGVVVAKAYQPDTQQTRPVTSVTTGGHVGIGVVTTGNPESWSTLIRVNNRVEKLDDKAVWALTDVGDTVQVEYKTNPVWNNFEIGQVHYTPRSR